MKTCFKCGEVKPLTDFYRHPKMADGHLNKCKACTKRDVAEHREAHIEDVRAYDRQRAALPHRKELNREMSQRYKVSQPKRRAAQVAVGNAVRDGRLAKLPCLICGADAEAHHADYDRPLDVVWLCPPHHKQAHALVRKVT